MKAIGVDIGGTGVKASIIDEKGRILYAESTATILTNGRTGVLESVFSVIDSLLKKEKSIIGIGVGTAGRVNAITGEVVYATANLPGWQGTKLAGILSKKYGFPCFIENDANAALIGEVWQGNKAAYPSITMLTLGTGVGGANMIDGKIVSGGHFQSGEWGHAVLVPNGRPCNCGMRGCTEQYLSGKALVRLANEQTNRQFNHGNEVFEGLAGDCEQLKAVVHTYIDLLALAIYNISVTLDPHAVIIGGGVIDSRKHWWTLLIERLRDYHVQAEVFPAVLGNAAGMMGAAKLVFDGLKKRGEA
ncbi:glucokinase [Cytobacillus oceanisediminis]|uniref:Glucokinase n=1 Tax=Cytobacillus oceanisediminis TaxID=665099 RepID=A0A2V3A617_9BACI|nr:ROK family protein [Cytobacillus oceanisediminis]PWW31310.1 glucokinase [Cytobacillus oceanisediminis]